jgi:hypothetical protein
MAKRAKPDNYPAGNVTVALREQATLRCRCYVKSMTDPNWQSAPEVANIQSIDLAIPQPMGQELIVTSLYGLDRCPGSAPTRVLQILLWLLHRSPYRACEFQQRVPKPAKGRHAQCKQDC